MRFRNQTVGGVILPQNLAAGREEDAADVAIAVILIFCTDSALIVRKNVSAAALLYGQPGAEKDCVTLSD